MSLILLRLSGSICLLSEAVSLWFSGSSPSSAGHIFCSSCTCCMLNPRGKGSCGPWLHLRPIICLMDPPPLPLPPSTGGMPDHLCILYFRYFLLPGSRPSRFLHFLPILSCAMHSQIFCCCCIFTLSVSLTFQLSYDMAWH
jgi:hypothetical protein